MMLDIASNDLVTIGILVFMEAILSIDNALVIAVLARTLPKQQQMKALLYGLIASVILRASSLAIASYLMKWIWVKYVGGGYLIYVAASHWFGGNEEKEGKKAKQRSFWTMVFLITLADLAFAIDSILAAVALSNKLWVVITGALIGLICMRFAAKSFIGLLEKFPNFEATAYILVFGVGVKLILDAIHIPGVDFHSTSSVAFWCFWAYIAAAIAYGFRKRKAKDIRAILSTLEKEEKAIEEIEGSK